MSGIHRAETKAGNLGCASCEVRSVNLDAGSNGQKGVHTLSLFAICDGGDFRKQRLARDFLVIAIEDCEHRLRFESYPLVIQSVKRAVEAAAIQIDSHILPALRIKRFSQRVAEDVERED